MQKKLDDFAVLGYTPFLSHETIMSELKFSCSHCGQHLQCDEQYVGRQIACPTCHAMTAVPPVPGKTAPAPQKSGMTFVPESWQAPPPRAE
jgi:hypothetical protein